MHSLCFTSLLPFNTLLYGKFVCNFVVPKFYYKISVLTVIFFLTLFFCCRISAIREIQLAVMDENAFKHNMRFKVRIVTSRRYSFSCCVYHKLSQEKNYIRAFPGTPIL